LTALALERALGVVVHTRPAFDWVAGMTNRPVVYAPLPHQPSGEQTRRAWDGLRPRHPQPPYKIVVFGYLGPNRRLDSILRALSELPERKEFRLCVYGTVWDPDHVRKLIRSYGLDSSVELHGFVRDLDGGIADAALAFNLRHPSMGEASAAQLRLWDHAIPTLVTKAGWYGTLPEDAVLFVRPECEVEDIIAGLRSYLRDPAAVSRLGEMGRHILDTEHAPEQYAASLGALVPLALREYPRTAALSLADRVGGELQRWAPAGATGGQLDRFVESIGALAGSPAGA
jgi:glycosyltransferase involved in cell wall biosynthesis